jgi:hypothetical protein
MIKWRRAFRLTRLLDNNRFIHLKVTTSNNSLHHHTTIIDNNLNSILIHLIAVNVGLCIEMTQRDLSIL